MLKQNEEFVNAIIKFGADKGYTFTNTEERFQTLNYVVTDSDKCEFETKNGELQSITLDSNGLCMPFVDDNNNITDRVVIVSKEHQNDPLYVVHELLHFFSTNMDEEKGLISGVDNFGISDGVVAINEGLTDYFTYKISGNYFNKKDLDLGCGDKEFHNYHYLILLINLLTYEDNELEDKIFNAYMNNDTECIYTELQNAFGLNRNAIEYLFERAEYYLDDQLDEIDKEIFLEDIEKVVNFYYNNVYSKKCEDPDFVDNYLKLFK